MAATAHWLCDDFDRDGTSPALPPLWTSVQQVSGGFVVLDSKLSRSLPKALLIQTSAQNSVGELHSDRTSSGASSYSAMRCRFDVFIESAGTSSGSGGKARIVNLKLRRGFADFVVVELKVNDGSTILEHGGLISSDSGVSIVPAVTFGTLSAMRWHQLTVTAQGTGYSVNLDGIETTVTLVGGSDAPFDGADLTFGLAALNASGPWAAVMDNVVCDALP